MGQLWQMGVGELRAAYRRGETTPSEVVEALIERIERLDERVGAFTTTTFDRARHRAQICSGELRRGDGHHPPLHGIPVAVKELYDVARAETTCGSALFTGRVPEDDAEAVSRLRRDGAIVLGLTRSHEFAWGITTQSERTGSTRNPWDLERVPGGSSGGSAAAVALGFAPLALGSDTGGSIRIPACFCGVAGFKPTYGAVPLDGACPLAPSLDHGGPLARRVEDLVDAHGVLAGADLALSPVRLPELRVGLSPDLHIVPLADDHQRVFDHVAGAIRAGGAEVIEVGFPGAASIYEVFAKIQLYEAYRVHTHTLGLYPDRSAEYSESVAARLELARDVTLEDYERACDERLEIRARFAQVFKKVDVLLTPLTAGGPSLVERPNSVEREGERLPFRELVMHYSVPQNVAGIPACAVPAGRDDAGMPLGVQISAAAGADARCLAAAARVGEILDPPEWPPLALETG